MDDQLKLENQLCFPLYAGSKEIIRLYKPFLNKFDLTYTQYIVMLVLWENDEINVKTLGEKLFLDSGTLTPLLQKLSNKGYIKKEKYSQDERNIIVKITKKGLLLKNEVKDIPEQVANCVNLDPEDAETLYKILYKVLNNIDN